MKSFQGEEMDILIRDKKEIKEHAQSIRSHLQDVNPNINIIKRYKEKL